MYQMSLKTCITAWQRTQFSDLCSYRPLVFTVSHTSQFVGWGDILTYIITYRMILWLAHYTKIGEIVKVAEA